MSSKTAPKKPASPSTGSKDPGPRLSLGNAIGLVVVAGICAFALWGFLGRGTPQTGARPVTPEELARRNAASPAAPASAPAPVRMPSQPPPRTGQPWEYDAATNHHWDPRPGHQHWHQGPPPPEDQRAALSQQPTITPMTVTPGGDGSSPITLTPGGDGSSPITLTPGSNGSMPMDASQLQVNPIGPDRQGAPWEYDAGTDAHWDPRPGHQHWHRGQPPPEGQRQ